MVAKRSSKKTAAPAGEQQQEDTGDDTQRGPVGAWGAALAGKEGDEAAGFSTDTVHGRPAQLDDTGQVQEQQPKPDMGGVDTEEQRKVAAAKAEADAKAAAAAAAADPGNSDPTINVTELVKTVEQIERINEEIESLQSDRKEFFDSLKGKGYKVGVIRKVIGRRQLDPDKRKEMDRQLALYEEALR